MAVLLRCLWKLLGGEPVVVEVEAHLCCAVRPANMQSPSGRWLQGDEDRGSPLGTRGQAPLIPAQKTKDKLSRRMAQGPRRCISAGMREPYLSVLRKKAPQARIVFDCFHIVRHLNDAVTQVRQQLVREADPQTRRSLRHVRFPVLKLPRSRIREDRQVLEEQVRGNRQLYRAMLLKDDFMDLYTYRREGWTKRFLEDWLHHAMRSKYRAAQEGGADDPQSTRRGLRLGPMANLQWSLRGDAQQHSPAQSSQLWAPLRRGAHFPGLPLLRGIDLDLFHTK